MYKIIKTLERSFFDNYMNLDKIYIKINRLNANLANECENGDLVRVKELVYEGANDLNGGLLYACRYGHIEIVKYLISRGADILKCISYEHDPDIIKLAVNFLISRKFNTIYLSNAFGLVCFYGDINLVKSMIDYGVTDFNYGLINAIEHGHKNIAELLIDFGADNYKDVSVYKNKKRDKLLVFTKLNENIIGIVLDHFKVDVKIKKRWTQMGERNRSR